ncbi:hypothetical protein [Brevibacterium sp. JSBI002]|uniref:hypothetical protein n=1 Tax=Brevibacterium sp. JSBI002 TaxID=2886045 RepID=UPI0022318F30|nr:hypothetical protein [Brevibacterium sp. JSBI002]UZD62981.1 hypothetical protein LJ362_03775 [Brevibacterium sp. JSBI002]
MMQPGLGAVIFLTLCIIVVFSIGAFLVYRVMNTPGSHIGSRLPKHDPHAEATPTDTSDRGSAVDQFDPEGRTAPTTLTVPRTPNRGVLENRHLP